MGQPNHSAAELTTAKIHHPGGSSQKLSQRKFVALDEASEAYAVEKVSLDISLRIQKVTQFSAVCHTN